MIDEQLIIATMIKRRPLSSLAYLDHIEKESKARQHINIKSSGLIIRETESISACFVGNNVANTKTKITTIPSKKTRK